MYAQQIYTHPELEEFATQLQRLQEMIIFFQRELDCGRSPEIEPIIKLMNCLVDLYE